LSFQIRRNTATAGLEKINPVQPYTQRNLTLLLPLLSYLVNKYTTIRSTNKHTCDLAIQWHCRHPKPSHSRGQYARKNWSGSECVRL